MKQPVEPVFYTITDAARILTVSRGSLYKMIWAGRIAVVRPLPDAPRILKTELDRFIGGL